MTTFSQSVIAYEKAVLSNQAVYRLTPTSLRLSTLSSASLERGRGKNIFFAPFSFILNLFSYPLSAEGEERVDKRSDVGVSRHISFICYAAKAKSLKSLI
ncbi:MAG: hypothetical protein AAGC65_11750 [Mucilaginibacter sp.]